VSPRGRASRSCLLLGLVWALGCGGADPAPEGARDAGLAPPDASADASADVTAESSPDLGPSAPDLAPPADLMPPADLAAAGDAGPDVAASADLGPVADAAAPADHGVDAGPDLGPPPATRPSDRIAAPRGYALMGGIIHLHSVWSHDACDGRPRPDGVPDAVCQAELRAGLCRTQQDFALLSDHPDAMAETPFDDLFSPAEGDLFVESEGLRALAMACPEGPPVLLFVGAESGDLMPLLLREHAADRSAYSRSDADSLAQVRAAGALAYVAHTEGRSLEELRPLGLDGLELYNLHHNADPRSHMDVILRALPFFDPRPGGPDPDLAILAIQEINEPALAIWHGLLAEGQAVAGVAGTDAHRNVAPLRAAASDGERGDSYRRMMAWFRNYVLVEERSAAGLRAGVAARRMFACFDAFGLPSGFDLRVLGPDGPQGGFGDRVPVAPGQALELAVPQLLDAPSDAPAPRIRARLLRIDAAGVAEVVQSEQPGAVLRRVDPGPGVYRAQVLITPEHLRPRLGPDPDALLREVVWIESNALFLDGE